MSNGNALVENCYSNMSIFSVGSVSGVAGIGLGGIGGVIQGNSIVRNCFSTGAVSSLIDNNVGGGFGRIGDNSLIENCFSTGTVVCDLYTDGLYGGLYGRIINNATIRNSAWCTDTSGITKDGSIQTGSTVTLDNVRGISSSQLDSDFYTDMSFDESIWDFSGELPILRSLPSFGAYYTPDILRRLQIGEMSDFSSMLEVNTTMNLDLSGINVMSTESSKNAIDKIDELLKKIATKRSDIGVVVSNLDLVQVKNMTTVENLTSAVSTIMDADIAEESAEYVKQRILNQTSSSLLSQASSMNNIALTMINRL